MKAIKILYILLVNGIFIPLFTLVLAFVTAYLSLIFYWGTLGDQAELKVTLGIIFLWFTLTSIYVIFGISFYFIKNKYIKILWTILFLILPTLYYDYNSPYDYRITLSFAAYHITYYVLFFVSNKIFFYVTSRIRQRTLKSSTFFMQ